MRWRRHWYLFCLGTTWWTLFFFAGLPSNYFRTTPAWMVLVCGELAHVALLVWLGWRRCRRAPSEPWPRTLWLAFYVTVPLFAYDWLYLGVQQGLGFSFLHTRWYLTAFYIIPWAVLPLVAAMAQKMGTVAR